MAKGSFDFDDFLKQMHMNALTCFLCCREAVKRMSGEQGGRIVNVSARPALEPRCGAGMVAYSAAKSAISNFTQWLAVHMCQNYSKEIRVNAIAPGFFITEQNRFLVTDEKTGGYTARGQSIVDHTPMDRFGDADELVGSLVWLISDAAKFVTGIVVPIDGGYSAFGGV